MKVIESVWSECKKTLEGEIENRDFAKWIAGIQALESEGKLQLFASNRYVLQEVSTKYLARIKALINEHGGSTEVSIVIGAPSDTIPEQPDLLGTIDDGSEVEDYVPVVKHGRRGMSALRVIEKAQGQLFEDAKSGQRFTASPLEPGSEFPSIFTRVPIFKPVKRPAKSSDTDGGSMEFGTSWGEGKKIGPMLTTYDEDTLLALTHQRQIQLEGRAAKFPLGTTDITKLDSGGDSIVDTLYTTIGEIESFLSEGKKSRGGADYKRRLASINRLNRTIVEFTSFNDRTTELFHTNTFNTKLVEVVIRQMDGEAVLYVQFPPIITLWLSQSYTYIDLKIRADLSDNGKAIHRALSGLSPGIGKPINIGVEKLKEITGSNLPNKRFNQVLRQTLEKLENLGWIKDVEFRGSGRRTPLILTARRTRKSKRISVDDDS